MVTIPAAPEGPTVYVVGEQPVDDGFRILIGIALKSLKAGACDVQSIRTGPEPGPGDRGTILEFLQDEYNARGAFIVGQSPQFLDESSDAYDEIDDACRLLGEVGVIFRQPGLLGAATVKLDRLVPADTPETLILGAGTNARALAAAITTGVCAATPEKVTIASRDAKGLADVRQRISERVSQGQLEVRNIEDPSEHDRLLALMPPRSAVLNASIDAYGMAPTAGGAVLFPGECIVADLLSPAGSSRLLAEADQQRVASSLTLHNARTYALERRFAILEAMFGADASAAQRGALRKALEKHDG